MAEANAQYSALLSLEPGNKEFQYYYAVTCTADSKLRLEGIERLLELKSVGKEAFEKSFNHGEIIEPFAELFFFLALAYHHNESFEKAYDFYKSAILKSSKKTTWLDEAIFRKGQCENAMNLEAPSIKLNVLSKSPVDLDNYFRAIDTEDSNLRLILTPSELRTKLDKKHGWVSPVAFDSESDVLYFCSYGKKGDTGLDIYSSRVSSDGTLGIPDRLPDSINSLFDDINPVFIKETSTLVFASNRPESIGGFDLFSAEIISSQGPFLSAEKLSRAWNTASNDYFLFPKSDNNLTLDEFDGWLVSDRTGTFSAPVLYEVTSTSLTKLTPNIDNNADYETGDSVKTSLIEPVVTSVNKAVVEKVSQTVAIEKTNDLAIQVGVYRVVPDLAFLPSGVSHFTRTLPNGLIKLFVGPFANQTARAEVKSQLISLGMTDVFNVKEKPSISTVISEPPSYIESNNSLQGVWYGVQIGAFKGESDKLTNQIAEGELYSELLDNGISRWYAAVDKDINNAYKELPNLIARGARSDAFVVKLVDGKRVAIVHSSPITDSITYRVKIVSFKNNVSAIDAAALLHLGSLITVRSVELGGEKIYFSSKSSLSEAEKVLELAKEEGFINAEIEKINE
ncbi:MAG: hypothetical protein COA49_04615 [Bacteroidetes bacterium]|nr:MAG: hypothetical protein COA49_04615 [Bacteroidota bacterium]